MKLPPQLDRLGIRQLLQPDYKFTTPRKGKNYPGVSQCLRYKRWYVYTAKKYDKLGSYKLEDYAAAVKARRDWEDNYGSEEELAKRDAWWSDNGRDPFKLINPPRARY